MSKEIEYKFLIKEEYKSKILELIKNKEKYFIKQAYINDDINKVIRIRTKNNQGYITIKGKQEGVVRDEFEYQIPLEDAEYMIKNFSQNSIIVKNRYIIPIENNLKIELDIFEGDNKKLIIAEIEVPNERILIQDLKLPKWIGNDVSKNFKYNNYSLSITPYKTWKNKLTKLNKNH